MRINELCESIADIFEATFQILPALGNGANWFFIAMGFVGLFFWLNMQNNYTKEARRNGTLE